jgi:outer membrane protein assembly factor BamB/predicted MPP superfamily phosphohydrolase
MPAGQVVERGTGRPLAGVVVSDGLAVAHTDADGGFSFPERADAEFVFVTVPSTHLALEPGWFVDVRSGSTELIRFELEPRPGGAADGCTFVQVTDLHVSVDEGARLRPMIEAGVVAPPGIHVTGEVTGAELRTDLELVVERTRPDFIVASGDLADYGQREELEGYRDAITDLGVPVASVPGNHDHLSVLTREAIDEFFADWAQRDDTAGMDAGAAFQREVFGGDWRRPNSGRAPWVEVIGPLYFSFDWGGVHFVAYDGEGLRRYGDDYPQDEWLANDLATVAPKTPVVVCTHFPETRDFYAPRFGDVRLVASISGHWHGTRIWHDGEAHHWTSSTLGFGGIDFTPRGYRILEIDATGARSRWETIEAPTMSTARVTGTGAAIDEQVIVASEAPDSTGSLRVLDGWTRDLGTATRGGVVVGDGLVFALDLNSRLLALDATTGDMRWTRSLGDTSERGCIGVPALVGGRRYAGSAMSVHAMVAASGDEIWHTELSSGDWTASWSGVTADAGTVVIGATNDHLHLAALDATTGDVRWRQAGRDIAGVSATPVIVGDAVLAVRSPGWLAAYGLSAGEERWRVPLDDAWPVALAVADDVAFVRSSIGTVTAHAADDGHQVWACALGRGARAGRPYSRAPGGSRAPLVVTDGRVWTLTFDEMITIDVGSGDILGRTQAERELATIIAGDDGVLAVTFDGAVVRPTTETDESGG